MDYFTFVGELGLGSRLKRLSDIYMNEVKLLYAAEGLDFEPRWFPLFSLLLQRQTVTVTAAAQELDLTHPHISQLAKELVQARLASFRRHDHDARSRVLALTAKGAALGERMQPLWGNLRAAVQDVFDECDLGFLRTMEKMEQALKRRALSERVKARATRDFRIVDYRPKWRERFAALNRAWIEKYFTIEPSDEKCFADPEKEILKPGGDIFFAERQGEIVGTCALVVEHGEFELAKLAVTERARGLGIGEELTREAIRRAKAKGAKSLKLITNSRLTPAVELYRKLGFVETFRGQHPKYARGDLMMEKALT